MEVKVVISPEVAILNGSSKSGTIPVQLTDEFIAELNEEERELLIVLVKHSTDWSLYNKNGMSVAHEPIARADLPSLKAYIQYCIAVREAANEKLEADAARHRAQQQESNEQRILAWIAQEPSENLSKYRPIAVMLPTLHDVPLGAELKMAYHEHRAKLQELADKREADLRREAAELEATERRESAEQLANIKAWIAKHGSDSMNARAVEGLLPEKELLHEVREWLFAPLVDFPRYERLDDGDARHADDCYTGAPLAYKTADADELTAAEYERLKALREAAKRLAEPAEVQAREHRVMCRHQACPAETMRRSVLVKVDWNGYPLSREYALTAPGEDSYVD